MQQVFIVREELLAGSLPVVHATLWLLSGCHIANTWMSRSHGPFGQPVINLEVTGFGGMLVRVGIDNITANDVDQDFPWRAWPGRNSG